MTIIAALPPAVLWAASFAASTDAPKGTICAIDARLHAQGSSVRIAAVDGHRCLRCYVPLLDCHYVPEEPLRLAPKAFSKSPVKKAVLVEIDDGGVAFFKDTHGNVLYSTPWFPDPWTSGEQEFPNIDQIWPKDDALVCKPEDLVAMNASYVGDMMKIVNKIGEANANNVVRLFTTDRPVDPIVWRATMDKSWLKQETEETVWLDYLLMPVQVRKP